MKFVQFCSFLYMQLFTNIFYTHTKQTTHTQIESSKKKILSQKLMREKATTNLILYSDE